MARPQNTAEVRSEAFEAQKGRGRAKGTPNKMTAQVKEMILAALDRAGGIDYLAQQAEKNPAPFLSLVGKVLPLQVTGDDGGPVKTVVDLSDAALAAIAAKAAS